MVQKTTYDAIVVGSGPNGLTAAIILAKAGYSVLVVEARESPGGGMRSAELTLPGFTHDVCSTIFGLGLASPALRDLPLAEFGVEWVHPAAPLAHPMDDGTAVVLERSIRETAQALGHDGRAYQALLDPLVNNWEKLLQDLLGPIPLPPAHPLVITRFGLRAIRSAYGLAKSRFKSEHARALFAGNAAHSMLPLEKPVSAAFGLLLGMVAHAVGWPMVRGGSQRVADALVSYLDSLGGEVVTGWTVKSIAELPPARAVLLDVTPRQLVQIAGDRLPAKYCRQLERYRYGPGVFKLDLALSESIPWKASDCRRAGVVHVGGTLDEIAASEAAACRGQHPERPFVLLAQQSLFDPTRAPDSKQTVWAYCHVPSGSTFDMTGRIEAQIERFAPGFRDCILAKNSMNAAGMELYNANYVGGDINGGVQDLWQHFTRPVARWVPYSTPAKGIYLCSSSTPPGGGVHGMCGYHAAQAVLKSVLKRSLP